MLGEQTDREVAGAWIAPAGTGPRHCFRSCSSPWPFSVRSSTSLAGDADEIGDDLFTDRCIRRVMGQKQPIEQRTLLFGSASLEGS